MSPKAGKLLQGVVFSPRNPSSDPPLMPSGAFVYRRVPGEGHGDQAGCRLLLGLAVGLEALRGPGYVKVQAHHPAGGWPDPGSRRPLHSVLMAAVLPAPVSVAPHVALSAATAGLRFPLSLSLSFSLGFSLSPPPLSSV